MANKKISQLSPAQAVLPADLLPIVQKKGESLELETRRITVEELFAAGNMGTCSGGGTASIQPNYAGHVTVSVAKVQISGNVTNPSGAINYQKFPFQHGIIAKIEEETSLPYGEDENNFFIRSASDYRFRENTKKNQTNKWEVHVDFFGLAPNANFVLFGKWKNPVTGEEVINNQNISTHSSVIKGSVIFDFTTISREANIGEGSGWQFEIGISSNAYWAPSSTLSITKIRRISLAMENGVQGGGVGGGTCGCALKVLYLNDANINNYISYIRRPEQWGIVNAYDLRVPNEYDVVEINASQEYTFRGIVPVAGETFEDWKIIKITSPNRSARFWQGDYIYGPADAGSFDADYRITKYWYSITHGGYGLEEFAAEFILRKKVWYTTFY